MPVDKQNPDHNPACAAVGEQLSAYLDGELRATDAEAVEAHLRGCPDCARLCDALRTLRIELAGAELDPPPALHDRIMAGVRRENRLRRLRRFTLAASAGVAAMFCFVIIGGAMMRTTADNAAEAAPGDARRMMEKAAAAEAEAENGFVYYSFNDPADGAMTGGVIDTTLVAEPTIVATGLASDTVPETAPPMFAVAPKAETTAMPETVKSPETAARIKVISAKLPETLRDLSRLDAASSIQSLSTTAGSAAPAADRNFSADSLSALFADPDARLAEEQIGTLCVVELDEGSSVRYLVYDLVTGSRLPLADFLGSVDAALSLGAEADTPYRPAAAGLCLLLPTGETCIAWDASDALVACVNRYAMTKSPLCGGE